MNDCYHTTKTKFLASILKNGLQPTYGNNSYVTVDPITARISYSVGTQGAANTFSALYTGYCFTIEGRIKEEGFRDKLSPQDFAKHQESVEIIRNSKSFEDLIKDNVYLCFDGDLLSEKNEDRIEDSYTTQSIPASHLKVCVIKNNKTNTIYSYSMIDIYSFFFAKNPNLKKRPCTYRYRANIDKFKSDEYELVYWERNYKRCYF